MSEVFPGPVFPDEVFPDPVFPGGGDGETPTVAVGTYRHSAPAPIQQRRPRTLASLEAEFRAMERE